MFYSTFFANDIRLRFFEIYGIHPHRHSTKSQAAETVKKVVWLYFFDLFAGVLVSLLEGLFSAARKEFFLSCCATFFRVFFLVCEGCVSR
jgi:hypothetical protein